MEMPKLDDGKVNPNDVFKTEFWKGKGSLSFNSMINFAIIEAVETCDFETEDLLEKVIKNLTEFSGSISQKDGGGWKSNLFMQGAGIRLKAEDQKDRRITNQGEE